MEQYKDFIENEKKFSKKFLNNLQIFDERFNEGDYEFIKKIFIDNNLISKIYYVIDDLILSLKQDHDMRFLVMGDFLFSMTSKELSDPSNLVLKTSRSDYLNKVKFRSTINNLIGFKWDEYVLLHQKLIIGLRTNNVLKRTEIRTLKDGSWETIIYMKINLDTIKLEDSIQIGFSSRPFILQNIGNSLYSISSFRNIWNAKRKRREMEEFKTCSKSIIKANQIKMSLSSRLININKIDINREKERLLGESNCINYEEYFNKVISIIREDKYVYKIKNDDLMWFDRNEDNYTKIMKNFQKIVSLSLLEKEILDKEIYLPCFIDNRGRQYYGTLISPTFYKTFRYLYEFVDKKDIFNLKNSKFYQRIIKYSYILEEFNADDEKKYFMIVLFIEIGKFFIKNKKELFIKTEDIIISGLNNYKNKNKDIDKEELYYLNKIYFILDNIIISNKLEDTIIFKDATASGLQNYGIMLGYKDEMLKYINIDGEDWCDTYKYLIEKFLILDNSIKIDIEKIKKRKNWKSTIMTIPYNATWFTCFQRFLKSLREEGIYYGDLDIKEKEKIKNIHKDFYEKIKNNIKKEFYDNTKEDIIEFKYNKWIVDEKREYKVNYKKARDKYRHITYIINEDRESSLRALEANNMHYRDSELVKAIMTEHEIIPIHDCFGIRLFELHEVMDKINDYYSRIIGKKTYCIHIIK